MSAGLAPAGMAASFAALAPQAAGLNTYHLQTFRTRDLRLLGYTRSGEDRVLPHPAPAPHSDSDFNLAGRVEACHYVEVAHIYTGTRPAWRMRWSVSAPRASCSRPSVRAHPTRSPRSSKGIISKRSAVVVRSSRVGEGRIVRGNNWCEAGMVVADNLSPQKAALLLTLALTKILNPDEIQRMFDEY
jgi:L-asparaginase